MKHTIYCGEFAGYDPMSKQGVCWSVEIWKVSDVAPTIVGELTFDGDTPIEIAYEEKAKHEPICGSSCTIKIISPSDRTYVGLYTIEAASIGVTIRRDGSIYWVGTLDPEFYEEPYESAEGYIVTLTFTDLGILERLKYQGAGMRSMLSLISEAAKRASLTPELTIDSSLISLMREFRAGERLPNIAINSLRPNPGGIIELPNPGGAAQPTTASVPARLDEIFVRSDNFFDDDGEASTLAEVIEGILQPLALRIEQRAGRLWVYDLNGLYLYGRRNAVEWSSDSQTLGVDEVHNNAIITWSPYAEADEMLPDECWPDIDVDPSATNLDSIYPKKIGDCDIYTYHLTQDLKSWTPTNAVRDSIPEYMWTTKRVFGAKTNPDLTDAGFTLWVYDKRGGRNVEILWGGMMQGATVEPYPQVFKIVPQFDGNESEGIALRYPAVSMAETVDVYERNDVFNTPFTQVKQNVEHYRRGVNLQALADPTADPQILFKTNEVEVPPMTPGMADLKISMELMFDMRFNPFETAVNINKDPYNLADREKNWQKKFQFLYVPVRICYRQVGGAGKTYIYHNAPILAKQLPTKNEMLSYDASMDGAWVEAGTPGICPLSYLAYYDADDRKERCGVFGWKTNRQMIPNFDGKLQTALTKSDDGQFIHYPPTEVQGPLGGMMWIEVMSARWWPLKSGNNQRGATFSVPKEWNWVEWILCKLPQLEIVSSKPLDREINDEDVEYRGVLNPQAKEDLEISTICGTKAGGIPTARGAYFDIDGSQFTRMSRAGRRGQVEDLLIGTLYSQYASRHAKLSGEATAANVGLSVWTEANQPGKVFIMTSQIQDLATCCGDSSFIELSRDEYNRKENNSNG